MKLKPICIGFSLGSLLSSASLEASGAALALRDSYENAQQYDGVSYLTAHNAFTFPQDGWQVYQQYLNFDEQFAYGVWSFMIDPHYCWTSSGDLSLSLAHQPGESDNNRNFSDPVNYQFISCLTSKGQKGLREHRSLESFLQEHVKKWLREDPEAVITLHLESYTGTDGARQLRELFRRLGIFDFIYRKSATDPWPTLGMMRAANTRLVLFSSNKADTGLGDVFYTDHYRETGYDLKDFSLCERRFDDRDSTNTTTLFVLNHFYKWAFKASRHDYHQINNPYATGMAHKYKITGKPDLATRTELCIQQEGIYPSFIAVDFVEEGDAGGARDWVLYLNHQRKKKQFALPFFHKNQLAIQSSHHAVYSVIPSAQEAGFAVSTLLAIGSYRFPWMSKAAALSGSLSLISFLDQKMGHYIPAAFAPVFAVFQWSVFYPLLIRYHPIYWFVWSAQHDPRNPRRPHQD